MSDDHETAPADDAHQVARLESLVAWAAGELKKEQARTAAAQARCEAAAGLAGLDAYELAMRAFHDRQQAAALRGDFRQLLADRDAAQAEAARLRKLNEALAERCAGQAELLARAARSGRLGGAG